MNERHGKWVNKNHNNNKYKVTRNKTTELSGLHRRVYSDDPFYTASEIEPACMDWVL